MFFSMSAFYPHIESSMFNPDKYAKGIANNLKKQGMCR